MSAIDDSRSYSLWERAPNGLISLLELMQKLAPFLSAGLFGVLARAEHQASIRFSWSKAPDDYKEHVSLFIFLPAEVLCREAGLAETSAMLSRAKNQFARKITNGEARACLEHFRALMMSELNKCPLFIMPKDRVEYFENEALFGWAVHQAFPSARMDIKEAGSCWALGRNNAVVYHLMSAAEFGLRALAKDRRVEIANRNGNETPLEFAQWGEILGHLQKKISQINLWPATASRAEAQQFYNAAFLSVCSFRDGYRNHIFHGRSKAYQDDETAALMGHVRRFLDKLSEKISESEITDEKWV